MSVITVGDISFLPYQGYEDPALPDIVWTCSITSLGDASAGTNLCQVNLKAGGVPPGNIFSLERISFRANGAGVSAVKISSDGFKTFAPDDQVPQWTVPTVNTDTGLETHLPLADANPKLWLGQGDVTATSATLGFRTANDNGEAIFVTAMGYMWTPRSVNAPGGPRRPIGGVFSN